jgi:hypothetical protein
MYGRCLRKGRANITDAEAYLRSNVHQFDSYVYGVYQELPIVKDIPMTFIQNLRSSIWVYINKKLPMTTNFDIKLRILSYINKNINNTIIIPFQYRVEKNVKINIPQAIKTVMDVTMHVFFPYSEIVSTLYEHENVNKGIRVGIVKLKLISEIENLFISDIENLFIRDIIYTRIH